MLAHAKKNWTLVLATLVLVAGMIGLQQVAARGSPAIDNAVMVTPRGERLAVVIPLSDPSRPTAADYRIEGTLRSGPLTQGLVRVVPDDCLTSLTVNDVEVPVGRLSKQMLCDWQNGFDVDLRPYLHRGDNKVTFGIHNNQGPWGLRLQTSGRDPLVMWLGVACFVLLVPYAVLMMRALGILRHDRRSFWIATALIVVGAAVRLAFDFVLHPPEAHVYSDMASYVDGAQRFLAGDRRRDQLFHPIGYPLMLALSLRLTGGLGLAVCLQYLLGVGALVLMWRASVPYLRERGALVVLAIGALHFPFISMSGFFLAETAFTFLLALLFYLLSRRTFPWTPAYAFAAGVVYMAASWTKGNNSLFGPLLLAWIAARAWRDRRHGTAGWAPAVRAAAGFTAGACLVAAITAASTYALVGHAQISASTGALNFVEGKCPDKINHDLSGSGWHSPLFVQLGEGGDKIWPAYFWDQGYFWKAGLDCVRADPWVLATSLRYIYYLFFDNQLWPTNSSEYAQLGRWYGMLFSSVLFPGMLVGLLLVLRRPLSGRRTGFLLLASLCVASWLLKSELRYRVPFDVVIIPLSVLGWTWLLTTIFRPAAARRPR